MPKKNQRGGTRALASRKKGGEGPPPSISGLSAAGSSRPPLVRMVRIHELLSAGKYPNCSRLAVEFEVSTKTIQRDIEFMRDQLALPIAYDPLRHGFHYANPVAQFPMITVSEGELVALLVAQKAVEQYRGTSFEKPLHAAFEKLVSSLGNQASVSLHELSEAVSFRSAGVPQAQIEVFEVLADALMTSQTIEFDYLSLRAQKAERRRVEPYHLACISNQWYLLANDLARGDMRTFALTRIAGPKNLRISFQRPADFSVSQMLSGSFAAFEAGKTERVRMRFDAFAARLVAERQWHKSQKLRKHADGSAELSMQVGLAPDLESWILGWGGHAEVLEPEALRAKIMEAAESMAAKYRTDGGHRALGAHDSNGGAHASGDQDSKQGMQGPASLQNFKEAGRRHPVHFPTVERHNTADILLVTVCTKNRKPILANQAVFDLLQRVWREAESWQVGRFVLMPDHLHVFCSPAEMPARSVKQWVKFWKAAASRQWPCAKDQPVWQVDFWDRQLRKGEHYGERWEYVRQNPVRAGLVKNADDWPWQGVINELRW